MGDSKASSVREVKSVEPSSLTAFFVFNPTLGDEDTEGDKILYFYPPTTHIDIQKDFVGLTEGLTNFTREWGKAVDAVHCEKNRYALFEAEKDYWICLVAKNPNMTYAKQKDPNAPPPKEITGKGPIAERMRKLQAEKLAKENSETEYLEDELEDAVLQAIIRRGYSLYKLCNDRFAATAGPEPHAMCDGITMLRAKLSAFMSYYLPTIRFKQLPFFTDIHGFQFMPVDKTTFLTIQYLVNLVTTTFPNVKASALMYNSKLIWSGLNQDDMFLLYSLEQDAMRPFFGYLCYKDRIKPRKKHQSKGSTREQQKDNTSNDTAPPPLTSAGSDASVQSATPTLARAATPEPGKQSDSKRPASAGVQQPVSAAAVSTGFLTGPLRNIALSTPANPTTPVRPLSAAVKSRSAPLLYLSEYPNATSNTASTDPFEAMAAANAAAAAAAKPAASYTARLVAYQQANITLFFVIADDPVPTAPSATTAAADVKSAPVVNPTPAPDSTSKPYSASGTAPPPATATGDGAADGSAEPPPPPKKKKITTAMLTPIDDAAFERAGLFPNDDSDVWLESEPAASAPASASEPAGSGGTGRDARTGTGTGTGTGGSGLPRPEFYAALEQHMSGNLKKLATMLHEQSLRSQASADDQFRFLYFNHMNLALKTSLNAKQSPLTMEAIKLIRNIHADLKSSAPASGLVEIPPPVPAGQFRTTIKPEISEVCVRTASQGWVIGRRATQTHREFFVLLDEKVSTLSEVQDEVDKLAKTYFYNIFSH